MPKKAAVTDQRSLFEALEPFDDGRGLSADATSTFAKFGAARSSLVSLLGGVLRRLGERSDRKGEGQRSVKCA